MRTSRNPATRRVGGPAVAQTRRQYHEHLDEIRNDVIKLAARSCEQIGAATQALLDGDLSVVEQIYATHEDIKALTVDIEHRAYELFALQQPLASDLRTLLAVLR